MCVELTRFPNDRSKAGVRSEGRVVDPDTSADKVVALLQRDDFHSGAHIDFYDV